MRRFKVNKRAAAQGFKRSVGKTKVGNVTPAPMRGGIRL